MQAVITISSFKLCLSNIWLWPPGSSQVVICPLDPTVSHEQGPQLVCSTQPHSIEARQHNMAKPHVCCKHGLTLISPPMVDQYFQALDSLIHCSMTSGITRSLFSKEATYQGSSLRKYVLKRLLWRASTKSAERPPENLSANDSCATLLMDADPSYAIVHGGA